MPHMIDLHFYLRNGYFNIYVSQLGIFHILLLCFRNHVNYNLEADLKTLHNCLAQYDVSTLLAQSYEKLSTTPLAGQNAVPHYRPDEGPTYGLLRRFSNTVIFKNGLVQCVK